MNKPNKIGDSQIIMTELVLPHHTNQLGNLLGGQLMHWIDICAALSGAKHSRRVCVTASVDNIDFHHPIKLGNAVTLVACINRVFNTSMEVGVEVFTRSLKEGTNIHSNTAFLTFVAVDDDGNPVKIAGAYPETEDEKRRHEEALARRQYRLKNRSKSN